VPLIYDIGMNTIKTPKKMNLPPLYIIDTAQAKERLHLTMKGRSAHSTERYKKLKIPLPDVSQFVRKSQFFLIG
jgi:hypothetical protein